MTVLPKVSEGKLAPQSHADVSDESHADVYDSAAGVDSDPKEEDESMSQVWAKRTAVDEDDDAAKQVINHDEPAHKRVRIRSKSGPLSTSASSCDILPNQAGCVEVMLSEIAGCSEQVECWIAQGRSEISAKTHTHLLQEILEAKRVEWETIVDEKHAVQVMSIERSRQIRTHRNDRIIPSRYVLVLKKDEQGNLKVKARLVMKGFGDPDEPKLVRSGMTSSPTVSQNARMVALQIIASSKWVLQMADIKGAFMESDKLQREDGPLYFSQPSGGIPGLHKEQLIQIVVPMYGLMDARFPIAPKQRG